MPHLPRRFRDLRAAPRPTQLAPTTTPPPDPAMDYYADDYGDLPLPAELPLPAVDVPRNPMPRRRSKPGLDKLSMKTFAPSRDSLESLFG